MAPNTTSSSSVTRLLGAILGAILVFAASPRTAQAQWATDCSKQPVEEYYNCRYCTDQIPASNGVPFSTASTNRVSQKTVFQCHPSGGNSEAEAAALQAASDKGMWSNSSYDRVQACLAIPSNQRADLVEEGLERDLNSTWRTPNDKVCTANVNQDCQDYAFAASQIAYLWASKYGNDACFYQGQGNAPQGPNGPRWSKNWQAHYQWCVAQTQSGNLQAVLDERNARLQTIDYCQSQNGQPAIDKTTGQPLPPNPPTERTQAFGSPVPVPPAVTGEGNTMAPRNPPNPFASGSGSGLGASATNPPNPFGSGSGSGRPNTNTGGYDTSTSTPQSQPPTVTTNPPNPFGSGSGSGRPNTNTGGYYPSQPQPRPNPGNPAGSGGGSGRPNTNTGGYYPSQPQPRPNPGNPAGSGGGSGRPNTNTGGYYPSQPQPRPNPGNPAGSGGSSGRPNTNTGGFNPPKAQPQPPKDPVVTTNRPNPFATPTNTTNVRSFTQTHARRSNGGGSSRQYRRYSPHGSHRSGSHHSGSHHGGGHHGSGHHGGSHHSDIRLKHNITLLGRLDNGLGFYRFSYNGSNKVYVGVMAQEVQAVLPMAVERGRDGYLLVHYPKLGLQFQTYEQWIASGAHVPSGLPLQH